MKGKGKVFVIAAVLAWISKRSTDPSGFDREQQMTLKILSRVGASALLIAAIVSPLTAQQEYSLSGDEVAIYNLAGTAEIVRGRGPDVIVRVRRGGDDAAQLDVEVDRIDGREVLRIIYPGSRIVYSELGRRSQNTVRVAADGTFGGRRRGDRVTISGSGRGLEAWADLEIMVPAGKSVSVYISAGAANARGVEGDLTIDTGSGRVTAFDITGSVNVDTGSGSVEIRNVTGDVMVDTGSGEVEINDVRGREVNVDTGSGGVTGSGITAESVEIDTGSGNIELAEVNASSISLDTGSGSVYVELLRDIDNLEIDTGSGSVTVVLPADVGAEIDLETGNGGIDLDFPVTVRRAARDHVVGRVGDGRGRIHIDTGSGSIRLVQGRSVR